jgi:hypothetical protein
VVDRHGVFLLGFELRKLKACERDEHFAVRFAVNVSESSALGAVLNDYAVTALTAMRLVGDVSAWSEGFFKIGHFDVPLFVLVNILLHIRLVQSNTF